LPGLSSPIADPPCVRICGVEADRRAGARAGFTDFVGAGSIGRGQGHSTMMASRAVQRRQAPIRPGRDVHVDVDRRTDHRLGTRLMAMAASMALRGLDGETTSSIAVDDAERYAAGGRDLGLLDGRELPRRIIARNEARREAASGCDFLSARHAGEAAPGNRRRCGGGSRIPGRWIGRGTRVVAVVFAEGPS